MSFFQLSSLCSSVLKAKKNPQTIMSSQSCCWVLTTMFSLVVMCGMLDYSMLLPTYFSKQEKVVPLTLKDSLRKMLTGTWQMLKWNYVTSWDENISAVHAYRPTNSRKNLPFIKMQDWYEKKFNCQPKGNQWILLWFPLETEAELLEIRYDRFMNCMFCETKEFCNQMYHQQSTFKKRMMTLIVTLM